MNETLSRLKQFLKRPFFTDPRTLLWLWLLLALGSALIKFHKCNNFLIFKYVFWHTWNQTSLYAPYAEYFDTNHYGPFFSLIIAPFAVVPLPVGLILWHVLMALLLYVCIRKLPLNQGKQIFIYWFCAHELLTALFMDQFNIFVASLVGWAVLFFVLPMLISSPEYIIGQYQEWKMSLAGKNMENMFSTMQNQSLLGLVRKISHVSTYSDLWLIVPGILAFCAPYLRFSQYKNLYFRYAFLASVLMFVVLFSTGSESSTYIIAFVGVALWFVAVPWKRSRWDIALMIFAFILTSLSPSDLFPKFIRKTYVQPYALKALPVVLIWFKLIYEMMVRNYSDKLKE